MSIHSKEFLDYYLAQVAYLREKGAEFSNMFPKVASQIDMSNNASSDPQVERILESFAFLVARLQKMLDEQSLTMPYFLLSNLNPYMLLPPPSMAVVNADLSPLDMQNGTTKFIKRHTIFLVDDQKLGRIKFSTVFDLVVYPFLVHSDTAPLSEILPDYMSGNAEGKIAISINISAISQEVMDDIFLNHLCFYISGDYGVTSSIYDCLALSLDDILLTDENFDNVQYLSKQSLKLSGFDISESSIPLHSTDSDHFRLLQEYFVFPWKFMFFNIEGLLRRPKGSSFNIVLILNKNRPKKLKIVKDTFKINTLPVTNLFYQQAQPINVSSRQLHYPVISNHIQGQHAEFYSVDSVQFVNYQKNTTEQIQPYHAMSPNDDSSQVYWSVKPKPGLSKEKEQHLISLLDKTGNNQSIESSCLTIRLLCHNGQHVSSLKNGSALSASGELGNLNLKFITKPTPNYQFYSNKMLWDLLCHYQFNFLNFNAQDNVLSNLKSMMTFMSPEKSKQDFIQINGINNIKTENTIRPNQQASWKGFSKHLNIHFYFDQSSYTGVSIALFSRILFILISSKRSVNTSLSLIAHFDNLEIVHE